MIGNRQGVYLVGNILFFFVHPSWAVPHYIRFSYKPPRLHSTVLKNQNKYVYLQIIHCELKDKNISHGLQNPSLFENESSPWRENYIFAIFVPWWVKVRMSLGRKHVTWRVGMKTAGRHTSERNCVNRDDPCRHTIVFFFFS